MTRSREYTREECLDAIRRVTEELGHPPTKAEYEAADVHPSERTIREVLGTSFGEAREMAGVGSPRENRGKKVKLDTDYFADVTSPDRAYWLGTVWGQSAQKETEGTRSLLVAHTISNRHFVKGLHDAIEAGYKIYEYESEGQEDRVQFAITNQGFIDHLHDLGLTDSAKNVESLPELPTHLRPHFVRGFLEVRARLSDQGLELSSNHGSKLETLADWIESFGVQRTYVAQRQNGRYTLRVGNIFDVASLFETCWVDVDDPSIRFETFYRDGRETICNEHPYPENLSFCDSGSSDQLEDETANRYESSTENADPTVSRESGETEGTPSLSGDEGLTISVRPSLVFVGYDEDTEEKTDPDTIVRRTLIEFTQEIVSEGYPDTPIPIPSIPSENSLELTLELPSPTRRAIEALINDPDSPFVSVDDYAAAALGNSLNDLDAEYRLTVDHETATLLSAINPDDTTTSAVTILEDRIRRELEEDD